jgi:peptidoglycan/xylan/chitin deacetylase (PgdA/CDA1 family)
MKQKPDHTREFILNLHGIGFPHTAVDAAEQRFWITKEAFQTLLDNVKGARPSNFSINFTFDDGNISDVSVVLPELAKRGLKAAFFVCAGRIGEPNYLDRIALRDLLAARMEIGTQGMNHRNWRDLDDTALRTEITDARQRIQDTIGMAVTKVAIPFGAYDRRVLTRLREERFDTIYTSDRGLARPGAWLKPRFTVDRSWQAADIKRALTSDPSLTASIRCSVAMLYKRLRYPLRWSLR